jgi:hypothetical protein
MVGASGAAAGPSLLETMIEVASGPGRRAALPRPVGTPRRAYVSRCGPTAPACAVPIGPPYLVQAPALISASSCRRSFLARGLLASHFLLRSFIGSSSSPASQQVKTASAGQNSLVNIHHVSCNLVTQFTVAVGTAIARRPPHGSRRAELPHRAPDRRAPCRADHRRACGTRLRPFLAICPHHEDGLRAGLGSGLKDLPSTKPVSGASPAFATPGARRARRTCCSQGSGQQF